MSSLQFKIISYHSSEYQEALSLRFEILRKPLGLTFDLNDLKKEKNFIHIAGKQNNNIVATAILVPENKRVKMKQVAVANHCQGQGIGAKLLEFIHHIAIQNNFTHIYCHARKTAVNFYLQHGYEIYEEPFIEVGIEHVKMKRKLMKDFT